jgi:hypothetical protein
VLIVEYEWDDENVRHVERHGLDSIRVNGMLSARITVVRNKRRASGLYKFIGTETGGHMVTIVVAPTPVAGRWRPVTGWRSTDAEKATHER